MRAGDAEIAKLLQEVGLIPRQLPLYNMQVHNARNTVLDTKILQEDRKLALF